MIRLTTTIAAREPGFSDLVEISVNEDRIAYIQTVGQTDVIFSCGLRITVMESLDDIEAKIAAAKGTLVLPTPEQTWGEALDEKSILPIPEPSSTTCEGCLEELKVEMEKLRLDEAKAYLRDRQDARRRETDTDFLRRKKMMLRNGKITILFGGDEGMSIELRDGDAAETFARVVLTPEQVVSAFSRLAHTPCKIELEYLKLDRLGKKLEVKMFEFPLHGQNVHLLKGAVQREAVRCCPGGWTPDLDFRSQDSFFHRDGQEWARTPIRRWVEMSPGEEKKP